MTNKTEFLKNRLNEYKENLKNAVSEDAKQRWQNQVDCAERRIDVLRGAK